MADKGQVFVKLVHLATSIGVTVRFCPFKVSDGRIKGDKIGIRQDLETIDDYNYNLAHEIAHAFLHYDKGNIIECDTNDYEEQADRAAKMLLTALSA